jgi:hypothetical protein
MIVLMMVRRVPRRSARFVFAQAGNVVTLAAAMLDRRAVIVSIEVADEHADPHSVAIKSGGESFRSKQRRTK